MTSVIFPLTDLGTPNTWTALQTFSGGISVGNISSSGNLVMNVPSGQSIINQIAGTTAMTLTAVGLTHTGYVYAQGTNYIQSNPANPTGTTSTVVVFMGLGSTVKLTPKFSGRVRIVWNATGQTATGLTFFKVAPAHGIGTPPTNGQSAGTIIFDLSLKSLQAGAVNEGADFTFSYVLTGLSIGTLYWFDLALATGNSSDLASITNISFYAEEF
jgi:hypothetical protein